MAQISDDPPLLAALPQQRERSRRWLTTLAASAIIGDICLIAASLLAAFWLKFHSGWIRFGVLETGVTLANYQGLLIAGGAGLVLLLHARNAYLPASLLNFRRSATGAAFAVGWWFFLYLSLSLLLKLEPPISRVFVILAALLCAISLLLYRWVLRRVGSLAAGHDRFSQRAIFVGFDEQVLRLAHAMSTGAFPPLTPAAIYSEHPQAGCAAPVAGTEKEAIAAIENGTAECVFLVDGALTPSETIALANACVRRYVPFRLIPSSFQVLLSGLRLEMPAGVPVLATHDLPLNHPVSRLLKRLVDIAGALTGLVLSLPLLAVCRYLIRRESPGPVIYAQRRIGRNGQAFTMYKLRTMRLDAEAAGPGWTTADDPRKLQIGGFLRRWNIDEVPQFWNVLRGEMSLVGPRPERPEWISGFEHSIPHYNARHTCKPGMTGWAQIHGLRGDTDVVERVRYDLFYLENWTLLLDGYILFSTLFRRKNAY